MEPSHRGWSAQSGATSRLEQGQVKDSRPPSTYGPQHSPPSTALPPPNNQYAYQQNSHVMPPLPGISHGSPRQAQSSLNRDGQPQGQGFTLPALSQATGQPSIADRDRERAREAEQIHIKEEADRHHRELERQRIDQAPQHQAAPGPPIHLHQPVAVGTRTVHGPNGLLAQPGLGAPSSQPGLTLGAPNGPSNGYTSNMIPQNGQQGQQPNMLMPFAPGAQAPPPQQSMAGGQGQQPILNDALSYLDQVKVQFSEHPDVYNRFLDIMKDFKGGVIDTPGVIGRVSQLFAGNPGLIQGFNTFLPPGYRIECGEGDDPNVIRVTTPAGTSLQSIPGTGRPLSRQDGMEGFRRANGIYTPQPGQAPQIMMSPSGRAVGPVMPNQQYMSAIEHARQQEQQAMHQQEQRGVSHLQNAVSNATAHAALRAGMSPAPGRATPLVGGEAMAIDSSAQGGLEKRGPVEFNHAISYVNKIKNRFATQPDIYKQFLEILQTYQRESKPIQDVYSQVTHLFKTAPDLLDDFKQFLPETAAQAKAAMQARQQAEESTMLSNIRGEPLYQSPVLSREVAMGTPGHGRGLPPVGNFAPTPNAKDNKRKRGERQGTAVEDAFAGSAAAKAQLMGPAGKRMKQTNGAVKIMDQPPTSPTLIPALPSALPPTTSSHATNEELSFFDRAKKAISNKNTFNEFLKLCNLFTQDLIDRTTLVHRAKAFIGGHAELMKWFQEFVGYDEREILIENKVRIPGGRVSLSNCRGLGPSYRLLPKRNNKLASPRRSTNIEAKSPHCRLQARHDNTIIAMATTSRPARSAAGRLLEDNLHFDYIVQESYVRTPVSSVKPPPRQPATFILPSFQRADDNNAVQPASVRSLQRSPIQPAIVPSVQQADDYNAHIRGPAARLLCDEQETYIDQLQGSYLKMQEMDQLHNVPWLGGKFSLNPDAARHTILWEVSQLPTDQARTAELNRLGAVIFDDPKVPMHLKAPKNWLAARRNMADSRARGDGKPNYEFHTKATATIRAEYITTFTKACTCITNAYCLEQERSKTCSGRDEYIRSFLNDDWASHPTWASEDSGFIAHRKNQYEDGLHRIEEERHDYDFNIETCSRTIQLLEPLAQQLRSMTDAEQKAYKLPPGLGGPSESIPRRVIYKCYGRAKGNDVIRQLEAQPYQVIPVLLNRLRERKETWQLGQREWEKVWRDQTQRMFYKSLDHQALIKSTVDKRQFQIKVIHSEIATRREELRREEHIHAGSTRTAQLEFNVNDVEVIADTTYFVLLYIEQNLSTDSPTLAAWFTEYIALFFGVDPEWLARALQSRKSSQADFDNSDERQLEDEAPAKPRKGGARNKAVQGTIDRDQNIDSRPSTPGQVADGNAEPQDVEMTDLVDRRWFQHSSYQNADTGATIDPDEARPRSDFTLWANGQLFCMMRMFVMIHERLCKIKQAEQTCRQTVKTAVIQTAAHDLGLIDREPKDFFTDVSDSANYYQQMLHKLGAVLLGRPGADWTDVEEALRRFYMTTGYGLYQFERMVAAAARFGLGFVAPDSRERGAELYALFKKDRVKDTITSQQRFDYRNQAAARIPKDSDVYRIDWDTNSRSVKMWLVKKDDVTFDSFLTPADQVQKWRDYLATYMSVAPTEGLQKIEDMKRPALLRNLRAVGIRADATDLSGAPAGDPESDAQLQHRLNNCIGVEKIETRIAINSYQTEYIPGTAEAWYIAWPERTGGVEGINEAAEVLSRRHEYMVGFVNSNAVVTALSQEEIEAGNQRLTALKSEE